MATAKPEAHLHVTCNSDSDTDALLCTSCTAYVHASCLVKHGRDKSAKKIQGAAPVWLHDVLHAAGLRYFCPTCLPNLACDATSKTDRLPSSPNR